MLRDAFLLHIRRMLAIVRKELLVLFCNPISRMLLFVPPLMQIIVFGWAATMEVRNVDVAVLDHDEGPLSREIVRRLEGSPTFRHVFFLRGQQEVRPAIEQEKALFVMVFDAEFSRRAARGEPVTVQLLLDGRRSNAAQIAAYYVQVMLAEVAAQTPLGRQAALAGGGSLDIRQRSWFNPNFEFQWFFLPNLIGMLSFMLGLVVTGLSIAREREARSPLPSSSPAAWWGWPTAPSFCWSRSSVSACPSRAPSCCFTWPSSSSRWRRAASA
mgnify:CR=1 FL=1